MKVEKQKFDAVLGKMLRQQPLKREDAKIGKKKAQISTPKPSQKSAPGK